MTRCICCLGFRACDTQKKLGRQVALVVLVLQVAQRKKPMMMSHELIVMVLEHATQKKDQDDECKQLVVLVF
jgi:hypothetical protein